MQNFSIAAGTYEGFVFRVNPVDSAIVEMSFIQDDQHVVIEFHRNAGMIGRMVTAADQKDHLRRDSKTGRWRQPTEAELKADEGRKDDGDRDVSASVVPDQPEMPERTEGKPKEKAV